MQPHVWGSKISLQRPQIPTEVSGPPNLLAEKPEEFLVGQIGLANDGFDDVFGQVRRSLAILR